MNAIIISAIWGVIMMFSGVLSKSNILIRNIATAGVLVLLAGIIMDMSGRLASDVYQRRMEE
ncbi:MAG: NADH-quinone oxidoreductase subunit N, partial [Sphingobacteriales bacterium]